MMDNDDDDDDDVRRNEREAAREETAQVVPSIYRRAPTPVTTPCIAT